MKTIFDNVIISNTEYAYFAQLDRFDQINYFFDLYEESSQRTNVLDLSSFFDGVRSALENVSDSTAVSTVPRDHDQVDVIIDDENILIESNSIRAVKHITMRFIESGYILSRDVNMEKMFRKDKVTRYMRIFKIIDQVSTLCFN
jgi:esterase/lipase